MQKQLGDPQISQRRLDDTDKKPNYGAIAGLIMGSPEFQTAMKEKPQHGGTEKTEDLNFEFPPVTPFLRVSEVL